MQIAGEILAHIADGQFSFCGSAAGESNASPENFEETRRHKAGIIEALELGFAYCERVFARTTDAGQRRRPTFSALRTPSAVYSRSTPLTTTSTTATW